MVKGVADSWMMLNLQGLFSSLTRFIEAAIFGNRFCVADYNPKYADVIEEKRECTGYLLHLQVNENTNRPKQLLPFEREYWAG